jgi:hypothetical protein
MIRTERSCSKTWQPRSRLVYLQCSRRAIRRETRMIRFFQCVRCFLVSLGVTRRRCTLTTDLPAAELAQKTISLCLQASHETEHNVDYLNTLFGRSHVWMQPKRSSTLDEVSCDFVTQSRQMSRQQLLADTTSLPIHQPWSSCNFYLTLYKITYAVDRRLVLKAWSASCEQRSISSLHHMRRVFNNIPQNAIVRGSKLFLRVNKDMALCSAVQAGYYPRGNRLVTM